MPQSRRGCARALTCHVIKGGGWHLPPAVSLAALAPSRLSICMANQHAKEEGYMGRKPKPKAEPMEMQVLKQVVASHRSRPRPPQPPGTGTGSGTALTQHAPEDKVEGDQGDPQRTCRAQHPAVTKQQLQLRP